MVNFADALDQDVDSVEAAPVIPIGTYVWEVHKDFGTRKAGDDWEVTFFPVKCVSPEEDVDEDELEAFGNPAGEIQRIEWMSPTAAGKEGDRGRQNTLNRIKKFLVDVLQLDESGTMRELMAQAKGCQFIAQVSHSEYQGDTQVELKRAAPLD